MGYTTEFSGRFNFEKLPPSEIIVALRNIEGIDGRDGLVDAPDSYNKWELSKDCMGLEWDGNEKFYKYQEWLQWIIDTHLRPAGVAISGNVRYSGEDMDDRGVLSVIDWKVTNAKQPVVLDDVPSLIAFRDFVLQSEWGDDIKRAFVESQED